MLTLEKLKVYRMFEGDIDDFTRVYGGKHQSGITVAEWSHVYSFCSGLSLILAGRASARFTASLEEKLIANTDSVETMQAVRELAEWFDKKYSDRPTSNNLIYWVHTFEL